MADVYKQSFKQSDTNNIELSIFNCGLERCAPGQTWGPAPISWPLSSPLPMKHLSTTRRTRRGCGQP